MKEIYRIFYSNNTIIIVENFSHSAAVIMTEIRRAQKHISPNIFKIHCIYFLFFLVVVTINLSYKNYIGYIGKNVIKNKS